MIDQPPAAGQRADTAWATHHAHLAYQCRHCEHRIRPVGGFHHHTWHDMYESSVCPLEPGGFIGPAGPPSHRAGQLRPAGEHTPDDVSRERFNQQQAAWRDA